MGNVTGSGNKRLNAPRCITAFRVHDICDLLLSWTLSPRLLSPTSVLQGIKVGSSITTPNKLTRPFCELANPLVF